MGDRMRGAKGLGVKTTKHKVVAAYECYDSALHQNGYRIEVHDCGDEVFMQRAYALRPNFEHLDDDTVIATSFYWQESGDVLRGSFEDMDLVASERRYPYCIYHRRPAPLVVDRLVTYRLYDTVRHEAVERYVRPDLAEEQEEAESHPKSSEIGCDLIFKPVYDGAKAPWWIRRDEYDLLDDDELMEW